MTLLRRVLVIAAVLLPFIGARAAIAADEEVHWSAISPKDRQVQWQAQDLAASPHMAEAFTAPLGYRIERYFWRAQKPAGAFAIVVLRDLTADDHYLSGPVDLMKFARTVLKGLEAPSPKALDDKDHERPTPAGLAQTRRFELGARQCLAIGFYAASDGKAPKGRAMTEGSLRLDGVYCATAGETMTDERANATAAALLLGQSAEAESSATK